MMKKNILFLTTQLPFPPHSGGIIKSYRTALHLSQKHHVDIACLLKDNNEIYLEQIKHEIPYQEIFYAKADIPRTAKNIIIANSKLKPISFYRNYSNELQKILDNVWQKYDVIFVGFPTWGMQLPPPKNSFLNQDDLRGKTIVPFNTHAGYGAGSSFETIKKLCPRSTILVGFSIKGGVERDGIYFVMEGEKEKQAQIEVKEWLRKLSLPK